MKLIKNVDVDWTDSKQRIRQDLDTIQRNINQILAQINAPTNATVAAPAVISSANTVTVPTTDFLSVVAHDSTLTGDGTVAKPLKTASSGVSVDPAGALSGVGTVASPLAVKVDGSSITINGSNQLTAAGAASPVTYVKHSIAGFRSLNSTPETIVAAQGANTYIIPVMSVFQITKPLGNIGNSSPIIRFFYAGTSIQWSNDITPGMGVNWTNWYIQQAAATGSSNATATQADNKALTVTATADMGGGGVGTIITSYEIAVLYFVATLP